MAIYNASLPDWGWALSRIISFTVSDSCSTLWFSVRRRRTSGPDDIRKSVSSDQHRGQLVADFDATYVTTAQERLWLIIRSTIVIVRVKKVSKRKSPTPISSTQWQWDRRLYQSINQFNSNLAAREPDSKWYAVEIIDKNSTWNKQCAYMYLGAGRDVWSGLGVMLGYDFLFV